MPLNESKERVMVDVWDWQTRALHWINALLIITLALLMIGKEGMEILGVEKSVREPVKRLHAYLGYVFVFTFFIRVLWAFAGNKYARWSDIWPFKRDRLNAIARNIRWYLSGFKGRPADVVGHDPLASIFYVALFLVLLSQAGTGIILAGAEFKMFPGSMLLSGLGAQTVEALKDALEEAHEAGLLFILFFLGAHLLGMIVHEVYEKNGLLSSMVHGKKYLRKDE